jgi:hypothetical protein
MHYLADYNSNSDHRPNWSDFESLLADLVHPLDLLVLLYIVAARLFLHFIRGVRIICVKVPLSVLFAVLRIIYGSPFEYFMVCLWTLVPLLHLTSAGWASVTAPSTTNKGASLQGLGGIAYTNVC